MQHYKVEYKGSSEMYADYPHDPNDLVASTQEYLEDMLSQGWRFVGIVPASTWSGNFIFECVAK